MQPLVNMQLVTNDISIKNNHLQDGQFNVSPQITRNIGVIDKDHSSVELILEIINNEESPFPVDIHVSLTGIFDISGLPSEAVDNFLKIQSVQILFPYIRSMVSCITSCSLLPPIILPIIDVRNLFPEEE
jgi:preprotein translocase subunit SecB